MKLSLLSHNLNVLTSTPKESLAVNSSGRLYRRENISFVDQAAVAKTIEATKAAYVYLDPTRWAKKSSLQRLKAKHIFEKLFPGESAEDFKIYHRFLKGKKISDNHLEMWLVARRLGSPTLAKASIERMIQSVELKDFPNVKTCPPELIPVIITAVENAEKLVAMIEENDQQDTVPFVHAAKKALINFINQNQIPFFTISENRKASEMISLLASPGADLLYADLQEVDYYHHNLEVTHRDIDELTQQFPSITCLRLASAQVNDRTVYLVTSRLQELTTLSLRWCGISDTSTKFLGEKLTVLDMSRCDISDTGAAMLPTRLVKLNLSFCLISDLGAAAIAIRLSELKILDLSWCGITDTGVESIVEHLPKLNKLNLSYNRTMTNLSAEIIANGLRDLTTLKLSDCNITEEVVTVMAKKLKKLIKLHLSNCDIRDAGAARLCHKLTALRNLNLSHCPISKEGIELIAKEQKGLTTLDLSSTLIRDKGVATIAKEITTLKVLTLKFCRLTDEAARSISNGLKKLTTLALCGNKEITLDSVALLAYKLNALTTLDVSLCKIKNEDLKWPNEALEVIF